jgi:hypothetical protein
MRPDGRDIVRVDKTLASERFDFKDVVNMVYRPSGIHSDLEGGADCELPNNTIGIISQSINQSITRPCT